MPTGSPLLKNQINFRLSLVCLLAASVGLSMGIISLAKLLIFLSGAVILLFAKPQNAGLKRFNGWYTPIVILVALATFAVSIAWSTGSQAEALTSFAKYGKLLLILIIVALIKDRREATYAMACFAISQVFLVLSSWMLFAGLPVPWATSATALKEYSVFSSYLDQGIIGAVFAAICWHLRSFVPGRFGKQIAIAASALSFASVLFILIGRSGHAVAIGLLSLAVMWELPKKYRGATLLLPFILMTTLFFTSNKVRDRLMLVKTEIASYSTKESSITSSGIRLDLWRGAAKLTSEHPLAGSGVGSWSNEYNQLKRKSNPGHQNIPANGNPHQEYLLWGMQLGIPGIILLLGLMISMLRDTLAFETAIARATQSTVAGLSVACLFNSSLYDALIGDFFCVTIGLLFALGASKKNQNTFKAEQAHSSSSV